MNDLSLILVEAFSSALAFILVRFMIRPYEYTGESRYLSLPLGFASLGMSYVFMGAALSFSDPLIVEKMKWLQLFAGSYAFAFLALVYYARAPLRSITATRKSIPRAIVGALREVTVTVTGEPNDFMLEVHTEAWFRNLALPGSAGLLAGGPLDGVAVAGVSSLVAYDYPMRLWKRIREQVKQHSKKEVALPKVMVYPPYF